MCSKMHMKLLPLWQLQWIMEMGHGSRCCTSGWSCPYSAQAEHKLVNCTFAPTMLMLHFWLLDHIGYCPYNADAALLEIDKITTRCKELVAIMTIAMAAAIMEIVHTSPISSRVISFSMNLIIQLGISGHRSYSPFLLP
ncbi:hypothetical protein L1987_41101 [Smallanthus sonchifolius]|uniref:Uncharacterized protein n=1 Tax=Smallanthus sonchifolius TaxID=185202 RepID=A0ACB9GU53_9ASTR|nr:hypothetical protein L1987_41101 [Smallanthus sonchifolius]